uniref:Uncharacterized protein n=1 Tax=Arundo donax TaxID=35708 RepID=A0A0A9EHZ9_ARUDO
MRAEAFQVLRRKPVQVLQYLLTLITISSFYTVSRLVFLIVHDTTLMLLGTLIQH